MTELAGAPTHQRPQLSAGLVCVPSEVDDTGRLNLWGNTYPDGMAEYLGSYEPHEFPQAAQHYQWLRAHAEMCHWRRQCPEDQCLGWLWAEDTESYEHTHEFECPEHGHEMIQVGWSPFGRPETPGRVLTGGRLN